MEKRQIGRRFIMMAAALSVLGATLSGCVPRSRYDEDIARLAIALQNEKIEKANALNQMEGRVQERGKTLSDLTARYMALEEENRKNELKLSGLKGDLEKLLSDIKELKLVLFTNTKGSEGKEMMIKLIDMENRLNRLIEVEKELRQQ